MSTMPDCERRLEVTTALRALREGRDRALEYLVDIVYEDLHRMAQIQRAKRRDRAPQTTVLVHELYLKLVDRDRHDWRDRSHFYAACATALRNILIDAARRRSRQKRGGGQEPLPLLEAVVTDHSVDSQWLISLDQALVDLARRDRRLVSVFELRYFGGYSAVESARILDVSTRTVQREWQRVCAWLEVLVGRKPSDPQDAKRPRMHAE